MGFIFINQFPVYDKSVFNQILLDQVVQKWLSDVYSSSRGQKDTLIYAKHYLIYFLLKPTCSKKRSYEASLEFQAEIDQALHIS
jgi:hypothetical protein